MRPIARLGAAGRAAAGVMLAAGAASVAPSAAADVLAGSLRYGGPAQTTVVCLFSNVGPKPVEISDYAVIRADGSTVTPRASLCGRGEPFAIAPGASCFIGSTVEANEAHACRALAADKTTLRGSIEIRDDAGATLQSARLR